MKKQTKYLFAVKPPLTAPHVASVLSSYTPTTSNTVLDLTLYPEPYYGDFNKCSIVLLTHNPGGSNVHSKGVDSEFAANLYAIQDATEANYFSMASIPNFPNKLTNNWVNKWDREMQNHFKGIQTFNNKVFIRDLVPYHSSRFGMIDMTKCTSYLYEYFFNQIIETSFKSEIYKRINVGKQKPATVIYARGKAWKDKNGLGEVGWDLIGKIYSYCYVYKANFERITKLPGFKEKNYPNGTLDHNVYIVVITTIREGAKYGIYSKFRDLGSLTDLKSVIFNYDTIANPKDVGYIEHNEEMDVFFESIR